MAGVSLSSEEIAKEVVQVENYTKHKETNSFVREIMQQHCKVSTYVNRDTSIEVDEILLTVMDRIVNTVEENSV